MIKRKNLMFYLAAIMAIIGAVGYQYFANRIPQGINPIVSLVGMYIVVLVISIFLLILIPPEGGIVSHIKQLNWVQAALAIAVIFVELGFLLMYRNGWDLSLGSLVTGVLINLILVFIGITFLKEDMSKVNFLGIVLSIIGVSLISYKP